MITITQQKCQKGIWNNRRWRKVSNSDTDGEVDLEPSKDWLEQAQHYKQPFVVARGEATYKVTVEKMTPE